MRNNFHVTRRIAAFNTVILRLSEKRKSGFLFLFLAVMYRHLVALHQNKAVLYVDINLSLTMLGLSCIRVKVQLYLRCHLNFIVLPCLSMYCTITCR